MVWAIKTASVALLAAVAQGLTVSEKQATHDRRQPPAPPGPPSPSSPRGAQTRAYQWTVAPGTIAPDGVQKNVLLVNNQFPGPTIYANYGDRIQVTVRNRLSTEGTSIHYHGLLQRGTPWFDGTPASQVCPIAPGDSFTQTFTADQYGSSWWHSHYSAQHVDGVKGPMIINGPPAAPYDIDLGAVFLNDWYHESYESIVALENGVPGAVRITPDSNLINGKGQYNCTLGSNCPSNTPYSTFKFQANKKHLLRVISGSADNYQCFSIDGHRLQVVAVDFTPVQPYMVDCLSLHDGQRADVVVQATQPSNSAWLMRAQITSGIPGAPVGGDPQSVAVVYYNQADQTKIPQTTAAANVTSQCGVSQESQNIPSSAKSPPSPSTTKNIAVSIQVNSTGHTLFYLNNVTFRGDYNAPILLLARGGNTSYPDPDWNVYNFGSNSSVRIVFTSTAPLPHPMHFHGHTMYVIAQGTGTWNGVVPSNPSRRDTVVLPPGSPSAPAYLVVQWDSTSPGVWPFHCHIAWHSSTGMYFNVLEQPQQIPSLYMDGPTSSSLYNVCHNWWSFTNHTVLDQVDSGL